MAETRSESERQSTCCVTAEGVVAFTPTLQHCAKSFTRIIQGITHKPVRWVLLLSHSANEDTEVQ